MLKINLTSKVSPSGIHLSVIESIAFLVFIYCGQYNGWLIFPVQSTELCSNCGDIASWLAESHRTDWGICKRQKHSKNAASSPVAEQHAATILPGHLASLRGFHQVFQQWECSLSSVKWWMLHVQVYLLRMNSLCYSRQKGQKGEWNSILLEAPSLVGEAEKSNHSIDHTQGQAPCQIQRKGFLIGEWCTRAVVTEQVMPSLTNLREIQRQTLFSSNN